MDKKRLNETYIKIPTIPFLGENRLSSLEFVILKCLQDVSREMIKPRVISWYLIYKLTSPLYLTKKEVKHILFSLKEKGFLKIQKNGIIVLKTPSWEGPKTDEEKEKPKGEKTERRCKDV